MSDHDLAVVGAGPAGLAAAVTAAERGLRVALVDAGTQPGGQFWRHPDERFDRTEEDRGQHQWSTFVALRGRLERLERAGRIDRLAGHQVWFVEQDAGTSFTLHLTPTVSAVPAPTASVRSIVAPRVVLCPGGYDRQLPVPGWDLPGVMAAGGVQALLKAHRSVAGRRVVVAGTGPFLLPVATGLAQAGATVVAVCEAGSPTGWARDPLGALAVPSKAAEAIEYATALARHRIPYLTRTVVTAVHGDREAESVSIGRLDRHGALRADAAPRQLDVDLVAFGWGFTPSVDLVVGLGAAVRVDVDQSLVAVVDGWQRTDVGGLYAAGEATGVGGASLAVAEGELAGLAAGQDAGRATDATRVRRLQRRIGRLRRFAAAMHRAHPVPQGWQEWLRPDTTVCRCEEVTVGDVCAAREELGADDARTVKLLARPGMGWCQGRVCGFAAASLAARESALGVGDLLPVAKRALVAPVSLGELAMGDEDTRRDAPGAT